MQTQYGDENTTLISARGRGHDSATPRRGMVEQAGVSHSRFHARMPLLRARFGDGRGPGAIHEIVMKVEVEASGLKECNLGLDANETKSIKMRKYRFACSSRDPRRRAMLVLL